LVEAGLSQKDAARRLGITPAAVSQYLSKKRAGKAKTPDDYMQIIDQAVKDILVSEDDEAITSTICRCCAKSRQK
jgi:predicted transcriptional regulator